MSDEKTFIKALAEKSGGKLIAIASGEKQDRQGDVIKLDSWDLKDFKRNPVLQFAHDYKTPPVGIAKNIKIDGNVMTFEPVFHEFTQFAKEIKSLYEADPPIMRAFSVGFIPRGDGKNELLEISCVPVPASREALLMGVSKGYTPEDEARVKAWLKEVSDGELEGNKDDEKQETEAPKEEQPIEPEKPAEEAPVEKTLIKSEDRNKIEQTISVLKSILEMSVIVPSEIPENGESKSERSEPKVGDKSLDKITDKEVIRRALQESVKGLNFTLNKLKQKE